MGWLPLPVLEFLHELKQEPPSAVAAYRAGVRFAFGSDPGVFPHGNNAREFAELVAIGMTPAEAIVSATISAADMLGRGADLGTLEPGKAADIIATAGSPLADISELKRVRFVMKGGAVFRHEPAGGH